MSKQSDLLRAVFGAAKPQPAMQPAPMPEPQPMEPPPAGRDIIPPAVSAKVSGMIYNQAPKPAPPAPMQKTGQTANLKKSDGWGQM